MHSGGSQRLQAIQFDSMQEQGIAHQQHTGWFPGCGGTYFSGLVILRGNPCIGARIMFEQIDGGYLDGNHQNHADSGQGLGVSQGRGFRIGNR